MAAEIENFMVLMRPRHRPRNGPEHPQPQLVEDEEEEQVAILPIVPQEPAEQPPIREQPNPGVEAQKRCLKVLIGIIGVGGIAMLVWFMIRAFILHYNLGSGSGPVVDAIDLNATEIGNDTNISD